MSLTDSSRWFTPPLRHYFVYSLDPAATIAWYCEGDVDEIAEAELGELNRDEADWSEKYFVGYCSDWDESFLYHKRHQRLSVRPLQRGLDDSDAKCIPVLPETNHPSGRTAMNTSPRLPWENCYHPTTSDFTVRVRVRSQDYANATVMTSEDHWELFKEVAIEDIRAEHEAQAHSSPDVAAMPTDSLSLHDASESSPDRQHEETHSPSFAPPLSTDNIKIDVEPAQSQGSESPTTQLGLPFHKKFIGSREMTPEDDPAFTPYVKIVSIEIQDYEDFSQPNEFASVVQKLERIVMPACERAMERRKIRVLREEQEAKKAAERAARAEEAKANNLKVTVDDSSSSINTSLSHSDISEISKDHAHSKHKGHALGSKVKHSFKKLAALFS